MPKKRSTELPIDDAERLTLELARRLKKTRAARAAKTAAEEAPVDRAPDAVDELMRRYDRSRPRPPKPASEDPKD